MELASVVVPAEVSAVALLVAVPVFPGVSRLVVDPMVVGEACPPPPFAPCAHPGHVVAVPSLIRFWLSQLALEFPGAISLEHRSTFSAPHHDVMPERGPFLPEISQCCTCASALGCCRFPRDF